MQTRIIKINPDFPKENLIEEAAEVLKKGGLVVFPTETVYGIGANLLDKEAIDRLYRIKKRPRDKPFTIHVARFEKLEQFGLDISERAKRIIHKFWPGPLTIVAFNNKREKLGIRMPRDKISQAVIAKASFPVVAPSANISGEKPSGSVREVISTMSGLVDIILDGGDAEIGTESTVLDVTRDPFAILRHGAIPEEDLLADYHVLFVCTGNSCRSVMAKVTLEKLLKQSGLSGKVRVDSAGTSSYPGILAAPDTIEVMKEKGVDVSSHKGKIITPDLLKKSDFIFVMERVHKNIILGMLPQAGPKLKLLRETEDIQDPIGKSIEEYRKVRDIINGQVENIFLELFKKEKKS